MAKGKSAEWLTEDGSLTGLNEQIEALSKAEDSSFLFGSGKEKTHIDGFHPAQGMNTGEGKTDISKLSYSQLSKYMSEHPDEHLPR